MGTSDALGEGDHGPKGRTATSYDSYTTVMLLQGFNKITVIQAKNKPSFSAGHSLILSMIGQHKLKDTCVFKISLY